MKIHFLITCTFYAPSPRNPANIRIQLGLLPETRVIGGFVAESVGPIYENLIYRSIFIQIFVVSSEIKDAYVLKQSA